MPLSPFFQGHWDREQSTNCWHARFWAILWCPSNFASISISESNTWPFSLSSRPVQLSFQYQRTGTLSNPSSAPPGRDGKLAKVYENNGSAWGLTGKHVGRNVLHIFFSTCSGILRHRPMGKGPALFYFTIKKHFKFWLISTFLLVRQTLLTCLKGCRGIKWCLMECNKERDDMEYKYNSLLLSTKRNMHSGWIYHIALLVQVGLDRTGKHHWNRPAISMRKQVRVNHRFGELNDPFQPDAFG